MANLPPNMNASHPQLNSLGHTMASQFNQMPLSNAGIKQDANSNNPSQVAYKNMNNDSGNSSPAFNRPPLPTQGRPQMNSVPLSVPNQYANQGPQQINTSNVNYGPPLQAQYSQAPQYGQMNSNTPPLIPSSQAYFAPPLINGMPQMKPPSSSPHPVLAQPLPNISNIPPSAPLGPPRASPAPKPNGPFMSSQQSSMNGPSSGTHMGLPTGISGPPNSNARPPNSMSGQPSGFGPPHSFVPPRSMPSGAPADKGATTVKSGPPGNISGSIPGPSMPTSGPPQSIAGPPQSGFPAPNMSGPNSILGPPGPTSGVLGPPRANAGPPPSGFSASKDMSGPSSISGPPGPTSGVLGPRSIAGLPSNLPVNSMSGPTSLPGPPMNMAGPPGSQSGLRQPPSNYSGPTSTGLSSGPVSFAGLPSGPTSFTQPEQTVHHNFSPYPGPPKPSYDLPPHGPPRPGPVSNQAKGNMQNRYPSMPPQPVNLNHEVPPLDMARYPDNSQGLVQQMGGLSVTKQGFDQLWGHQMIDLLQNRHIIPPYVEDPPPIKLTQQFADSPNCSPEIFRCTLNRIPETNNLLQKSRLPLGVLIHPFKDLNHLPVIQCMSIVRCRACRTYINPFVYFVDSKRWKCNLCFRVNDLPDEFQYDPVTKSYGDPSRRPEIKSATIEYIAPSEYMLRPPQPAVYLFLLDVSQLARESGYLQIFCDTLKNNLDQLPGDLRTQVGFICYDAHIHYYLMSSDFNQPKEMTVIDIDDIFLPSPTSLLVNLHENRNLIVDLLTHLPKKYSHPGSPGSALGAALQAAHKLMGPTGGRITVFQTCLPNIGPGALTSREDPNARSAKEVSHLTPATDFYKRMALDCSAAQVAVDLFLLNSQYSDLATLSGVSKFSGGTVYHIPLFNGARSWQCTQLNRMITRYLTRKIGFEAVMRVRCTRGITIHTFHGNFFVRSTDLLSLPNVSPDAGFGMQLSIEESLSDLQQVCFQAALLYTSSKGERRIRVHTMALPIASNLTDVLHHADQECIIGLLSKMAVDRCVSASMSEAREALMTVAVDALSAHRLAQNLPIGSHSNALHAPYSLRLLPLYLLALLKRRAFRTGTSTRLDDRVADMCEMKTLPLAQLLRAVYPDLYPIHTLHDYLPQPDPDIEQDENVVATPPRLQLTAEKINMNGAYLLDDGELMIIYIGSNCTPAYLSETWGVAAHSQLAQEARILPRINTPGNVLLHTFIEKLNEDRPYVTNLLIIKDTSPSRTLFTERLVDDRVESAFSYYEFLQHIKTQVK